MSKIFIVEDDENIRGIVTYALQSVGFEAFEFETGEDMMKTLAQTEPSLIILDIMLPGDDGLVVLSKLKSSGQTENIPVIMLTAKGSEFDKVKGLDMGADDYIAKPFGVMELISRVNAVLRRSVPLETKAETLRYENITIDTAKRAVYVNDNPVKLTFKEYELLFFLAKKPGVAQSRPSILYAVWGDEFEGESRTLDMHIKSLRNKLGEAGTHIKTIRKVGYKLGD